MTSVRSQLRKLYAETGDDRFKAVLEALNELNEVRRKPPGRPRRYSDRDLINLWSGVAYVRGMYGKSISDACRRIARGDPPFLIVGPKGVKRIDAGWDTLRRRYYQADKLIQKNI